MVKLNEDRKYCRMLSWSILQYFWPALSNYLSWKPILVFFLSGHLRQVLLYVHKVQLLISYYTVSKKIKNFSGKWNVISITHKIHMGYSFQKYSWSQYLRLTFHRISVSKYSQILRFIFSISTVKHVLSGHSKRRPKIGFQDRLSLNAGQKYCRMLQYFWPSLSYHLSLRPLFCLFLSGHLRQV